MRNKSKISSSEEYWKQRYSEYSSRLFKGASGNGRLPFRVNYKSKVLNEIIVKYKISSIIDFGCGDGILASKLHIDRYDGLEIDESLVDELSRQFQSKPNYNFSTKIKSTWPERHDLALSVDVIFHLLEDDVYRSYMFQLFSGKSDYVVIRSSNHEELGMGRNGHIRHRNFSEFVSKNFGQYNLIAKYGPRRKRFYLSISDRDFFFVYRNSK